MTLLDGGLLDFFRIYGLYTSHFKTCFLSRVPDSYGDKTFQKRFKEGIPSKNLGKFFKFSIISTSDEC